MDAKGQLKACPWLVGSAKREGTTLGEYYQVTQGPDCSSCWVQGLCGGGCRYHLESTGSENFTTYCERMKFLIQLALTYYTMERQ